MSKTTLLLALLAALITLFIGLGNWQLERRVWKLALIEQVETQLTQPPQPAPGPESWTTLQAEDAYRPVKLSGHFLHDKETRVQAMTRYGSGYWLLTPLQTERGFTVLVNRGFIDPAHQTANSEPYKQNPERIKITGLLRLTEPNGRLFQANQPSEDRWYSRDIQAIAKARQLAPAELAPYFVDAAAGSAPNEQPVGGLTVVQFRNMHLSYALTWYGLAVLCVIAAAIVLLHAYRKRLANG